ncbi:carotenoid biosynthesis protein [Candidatus Nomurabacteria bacterium]|jgi:uncharacterized membrane protein|nr:carotenoid biosynthesis protein [Candidatus Saccharibacteria bacterium]MCA9351130.1 carotenoid biosynthesis protein [Candidatus Saccharibacteria bacterium]MCB9839554.1 carotenoid biosynthesis protein [Candidatus Nomurabacteria bacterium]
MLKQYKNIFQPKNEWLAAGGVLAFLVFGVFLYYFGLEFILLFTPVILSVILILMLYFWHQPLKIKYWSLAIVTIFGYLVEVVGIKTGLLFGDYSYGNLLGWKIFSTPIIIGLLWFIVSLSSWQIAGLYRKNRLITYALALILLISFDLILEQFAISYKLWFWPGNVVPLYNYISWAIVGILIFVFYDKFLVKGKSLSPFIMLVLPILSIYMWLMLVISYL